MPGFPQQSPALWRYPHEDKRRDRQESRHMRHRPADGIPGRRDQIRTKHRDGYTKPDYRKNAAGKHGCDTEINEGGYRR